MRSVGGKRVRQGIWPSGEMWEVLPWGWVVNNEFKVQSRCSGQKEQPSVKTKYRSDGEARGTGRVNTSSSPLPVCSPSQSFKLASSR